jgi:hypothetical protein
LPSRKFNLYHYIKGHEWHIQASCALTGEGLWEGLSWVAAHCSTGGPVGIVTTGGK